MGQKSVKSSVFSLLSRHYLETLETNCFAYTPNQVPSSLYFPIFHLLFYDYFNISNSTKFIPIISRISSNFTVWKSLLYLLNISFNPE